LIREYSYSDVPTIKKFAKDSTFMRAITGPFGSGKSSGCCMELYRKAVDQDPDSEGVRRTRFAAVRNSYPQLRDTTKQTWDHWFEHMEPGWKISDHDFYLNTTAPDGSPVQSVIHFRPLDKPTDIKNLLSLELTGAWFNEMREIPMSIVNAMRGRVGRFPPKNPDGTGGASWKGIIGDTNPPDVDHPFFKLFEEDQPHACRTCRTPRGQMVLLPSRNRDNTIIPLMSRECPMCKKGIENAFPLTAIFHQPSGLSPEAENLAALPPDYYQMLAAGMDQDFINVYVHGQYGYVKDGKPVYLNYDPNWHFSKEILKARPNYPIIISFDNTGLTQACVISQYLPNGQFRALHEWLVEGMGTRRLCRDLVRPFVYSTYPGIMILLTGDPAGVKGADTDERNTFEEITEAFGLPATPARSNSFQSRFNAVDSFLQKRIGTDPGFLVSQSCKMLHRGFCGEYKMKRLQIVSQEKYVNRPDKNLIANVHDALQYGCMFVEDLHDLMRRDRFDSNSMAQGQFGGAGDWGAFN
jgi:hypothetical protein